VLPMSSSSVGWSRAIAGEGYPQPEHTLVTIPWQLRTFFAGRVEGGRRGTPPTKFTCARV